MVTRKILLSSASAISVCLLVPVAHAQVTPTRETAATVDVLVVTAQKREESINDVGMSISAASGDTLTELGVTDASQLDKIVPGFTFTPSYYGTPIYTIRGVGFVDTSLAGSPTVSVYVDEVPLPYSIMTSGAALDLERVEVLKGPQGTLFGSNATGGAINYIAAKPTKDFKAGFDASYGRFNTVDLQGFVSGGLAENLSGRLAARILRSGPWQQSYTRPDEWGAQDMLQVRAALKWEPSDNLTANFTLSGFADKGDSQMPQLFGIAVLSPTSGLDPRIRDYPLAPANARAADWGACVNNSPSNPPFGLTLFAPGAIRPASSTSCSPARKDNNLVTASLRVDYDINESLTLTSISAGERFRRDTFIEGDGTIYQDYESRQIGRIDVVYQELRLTGDFNGKGTWVVGANYERDKTLDRFLQTYGGSTANPTALPTGFIPLGPTQPLNSQVTKTQAIFLSGDYPITETLTIQAGIRATESKKDFNGCGYDGGDGSWSTVSQGIQNLLQWIDRGASLTDTVYFNGTATGGGTGINVGPGACATTGPGPDYHPAFFTDNLNEENVSWRAGLNWSPNEDTLIYGNVSKGFKSGAYPTVATSAYVQLAPAVQEELLAYELGFKASLFDRSLQLNGALFYYDYNDKQLLGAVVDPVFGPLPKLVNVPESRVQGFELSAVWQPIPGLRISPVVSYSDSKVEGCDQANVAVGLPGCRDGNYYNFDAFSNLVNLTGQAFPSSPKWQSTFDAQYKWPINDKMDAFVGANVNYHDSTPGFFFERNPDPGDQPANVLNIKDYTLLDLRGGIEAGPWRVQAWGRNVTDEYYWHGAAHVNDVLVRFAGQPRTFGLTVSYRYE